MVSIKILLYITFCIKKLKIAYYLYKSHKNMSELRIIFRIGTFILIQTYFIQASHPCKLQSLGQPKVCKVYFLLFKFLTI